MTIDFRNNSLNGLSKTNPHYRTSKTRICVTVGMMTTGYDCTDILNICMMRPIFSPSEFIQMKGRGTENVIFLKHGLQKQKFQKKLIPHKEKNFIFLIFW